MFSTYLLVELRNMFFKELQKTCKKKVRRPNEFTRKQKKIIASNQKWTCNMCKEMLKDDYEIDHKIPLHQGGTCDTRNGQALCPDCHREKTKIENKKLNRKLKKLNKY